MLMYQGKIGGVCYAEVPALTWLILYYEYQDEVRSVLESIYPSLPNNTGNHHSNAINGNFNWGGISGLLKLAESKLVLLLDEPHLLYLDT